jgi:hypothetical protein
MLAVPVSQVVKRKRTWQAWADIRHLLRFNTPNGRIPAKCCPAKTIRKVLQAQAPQAIARLLCNVAHSLQ